MNTKDKSDLRGGNILGSGLIILTLLGIASCGTQAPKAPEAIIETAPSAGEADDPATDPATPPPPSFKPFVPPEEDSLQKQWRDNTEGLIAIQIVDALSEEDAGEVVTAYCGLRTDIGEESASDYTFRAITERFPVDEETANKLVDGLRVTCLD